MRRKSREFQIYVMKVIVMEFVLLLNWKRIVFQRLYWIISFWKQICKLISLGISWHWRRMGQFRNDCPWKLFWLHSLNSGIEEGLLSLIFFLFCFIVITRFDDDLLFNCRNFNNEIIWSWDWWKQCPRSIRSSRLWRQVLIPIKLELL